MAIQTEILVDSSIINDIKYKNHLNFMKINDTFGIKEIDISSKYSIPTYNNNDKYDINYYISYRDTCIININLSLLYKAKIINVYVYSFTNLDLKKLEKLNLELAKINHSSLNCECISIRSNIDGLNLSNLLLAPNLKYLYICNNYNHILLKYISKSLIYLYIEYSYNIDILNYFNHSLIYLQISQKNDNLKYSLDKLPYSLEVIKLSYNINIPINNLPINLIYLEIGTCNNKIGPRSTFNQNIDNLPPNLQTLIIGHIYDPQEIGSYPSDFEQHIRNLPKSLLYLKLEGCYCFNDWKSLYLLPPNLKILYLSGLEDLHSRTDTRINIFNYLPQHLLIFYIDNMCINKSDNWAYLPQSLIYLHIISVGYGYYYKLDKLPIGLKFLKFSIIHGIIKEYNNLPNIKYLNISDYYYDCNFDNLPTSIEILYLISGCRNILRYYENINALYIYDFKYSNVKSFYNEIANLYGPHKMIN